MAITKSNETQSPPHQNKQDREMFNVLIDQLPTYGKISQPSPIGYIQIAPATEKTPIHPSSKRHDSTCANQRKGGITKLISDWRSMPRK
jgi:hypothetical protein